MEQKGLRVRPSGFVDESDTDGTSDETSDEEALVSFKAGVFL